MDFNFRIHKDILHIMTHDELIRYLAMISNHKDLFDRKFYTELELRRFISFINNKYASAQRLLPPPWI